MSEYIIDIDVDKARFNDDGTKIQLVPTVLREIVRCRDCVNFATDELGDFCTLLDFEDVKSMGDKFCAWGERRDA